MANRARAARACGTSGERCGGGQVQPAAAGAGVPGRDREQSLVQALGFPAAGGVAGQGEGLSRAGLRSVPFGK
jgi:hypothetical protein